MLRAFLAQPVHLLNDRTLAPDVTNRWEVARENGFVLAERPRAAQSARHPEVSVLFPTFAAQIPDVKLHLLVNERRAKVIVVDDVELHRRVHRSTGLPCGNRALRNAPANS